MRELQADEMSIVSGGWTENQVLHLLDGGDLSNGPGGVWSGGAGGGGGTGGGAGSPGGVVTVLRFITYATQDPVGALTWLVSPPPREYNGTYIATIGIRGWTGFDPLTA